MTLSERYAAAEAVLPHRWERLVRSGRVVAEPCPGGFWFVDEGQLVVVDVTTATKRVVEISGIPVLVTAQGIGVVRPDGELLPDGTLLPTPVPGESLSPDRRRAAFVRDHDLWVRDRGSGNEVRLTHDGTAELSYGTPSDVQLYASTRALTGAPLPVIALWSADSRLVATHRTDQRGIPLAHLVAARPEDGGRPRLRSWRYPMLGEPHQPHVTPVVLDVDNRTQVDADCAPFLAVYTSPIVSEQLWWDGQVLRWVAGTDGDRSQWVSEMDVSTGAVRVLSFEEADERLGFSPWLLSKPLVRVLASGEVLAWSERSRFGHLELDGRALTAGPWNVRDLIDVDEAARTATFTATGRVPDGDPYLRELLRVHLDDGELDVLVSDSLDHEVTAVAGGFVDIASRWDTPAVATLRAPDGAVRLELCRADASALYAAGWRAPERVRTTAADGVTQVWGFLHAPRDLDAPCPIIDDTYPGPQSPGARVRFPGSGGNTATEDAWAFAELGFGVVVVDGRGSPLRGRDFHDALRKDFLANLDDHIAAIEQLSATRPWMDTSRVGIYGGSAGGDLAARGVLRRGETFGVGVALCGSHDDRMYYPVWGEMYFDDHVGNANETYAAQLRGRLLLVHGELDDNVLPQVSLRLVDAIMRADRDVDLLLVPGADHVLGRYEHHWKRRTWDYLVRHLMGAEPPPYRLTPWGPPDRESS